MKTFEELKQKWSEKISPESKVKNVILNTRLIFVSPKELDLWVRGVLFWDLENGKNPVIRVGAGFLKFYEKNQKLSQFELLRALFYGVTPRELQALGVATSPWPSFVKCMSFRDRISERFISATALAWISQNPECRIEGFSKKEVRLCLNLLKGFH